MSLSPFMPESLVSRDGFGSPVPRQPAHLHVQTDSSLVLTYYRVLPEFRSGVHLFVETTIRHQVLHYFACFAGCFRLRCSNRNKKIQIATNKRHASRRANLIPTLLQPSLYTFVLFRFVSFWSFCFH